MSTDQEKIDRFWDNYLLRLEKKGVKPEHRQWFVKRAEGFLKAIQPRRLAELDARDVADYLSRAGRDARLKAWQFRQVVDAIYNLGETAQAPWVAAVDWRHLERARRVSRVLAAV